MAQETPLLATHPVGSIAERFDDFQKIVLDPIDAGAVQRQEMRRAFYAGATAMLGLVFKGAHELDDAAAETFLAFLDAELDAWRGMLDRGDV